MHFQEINALLKFILIKNLVGIKSIKRQSQNYFYYHIYPELYILPCTLSLAKNDPPCNFALACPIFSSDQLWETLSFFCELTEHCLCITNR